MPTKEEMLAEAYRRGLLPPDKRAAYEEAQRRGLVAQSPAKSVPQRPVKGAAAAEAEYRKNLDLGERVQSKLGRFARLTKGPLGGSTDEMRARVSGASLGWSDELLGAVGEGGVNAYNFLAEKTGLFDAKPYTGEEYGDAVRKVERERQAQFRRERPVTAMANELAGGAAIPGAAGFIGKASTLPGAVGRSAVVGAGFGGVAGAGMAEDGERLKGAGKGALAGAAIGGAVPVAARSAVGLAKGARRLASGGSEAVERTARALGVPQVRPRITEGATRRAEDIVAEMAARKGVTPQTIAADPRVARGAIGAELLGREGVMTATALGRRSGDTADLLEGVLRPRLDQRAQALADDLGAAAGLDPTFAAGDFLAQAGKARELADPLYRVAYDAGPVQSNVLDDLARRPSVREALKRAYKIAQEEGVDPEALGLRFADVAEDWASEAPTGLAADRTFQKAARAVERGVQPNVSRGRSLTKFIADNGGVRDDGGELARWDLDKWHADKAYQRKLVNPNGEGLDDVALRAWENGYFPELQTRPTPNQLLDALEAEMRGRPRYAREAAGAERAAMLDEAEEMMARGYDGAPAPSPEDYVGRPEPRTAPVFEGVPTMRTWDYVKRGLDDVVEDYRDPVTRRLNLNTEGQAVERTRKALHSELTRKDTAWGQAYRDALRAGGDPIRMEQAFRDAPKLFGNGVRVRDFDVRLQKMGGGEKQGLVAGLVDDLQGKADAGKLRPKEYQTPLFRQKLERVLGREPAAQFLEDLRIRSELAATGQRMIPGTNSTTGEVSETMRDLDRDGSILAQMERRISGGQNVVTAVPQSVVQGLVGDPIAGFLRGVQAPYGRAVRDELGRMLASPDDLAAALERQAVRAAERPRIGAAGRGVPQLAPAAAAFGSGVIVRNGSGEPMGVQYEDGGFTPYDSATGQPMVIEGREVVSYPDGTLRFRDTGEVAPY